MNEQDLLQAIRQMIREESQSTLQSVKVDIQELRNEMQNTYLKTQEELEEINTKLQAVKPDIMDGVSVLLDTEFKRNFNLLWDRLDEIAVKMPSEDDMDIIDGRLAEHDDEFKVVRQDVATLRQDVDKLKKAQ